MVKIMKKSVIKNIVKIIPPVLMSLSLIGCQSANQTISVFQLSQGPVNHTVNFEATQLMIKRIEVVDYLKQSNLVFELDNNELMATKYQVWAEPIGQGITRALVNNINASQQVIRADSSSFSSCHNKAPCYSLQLLVEKFYPSFDSSVSFSGKYKLYLDETLIEQQDFNLSKTLTQDGYPHAVDSLRLLIGELGKVISKRVSSK